MNKFVIWSPLAEKDFSDILDYLNENWGLTTTNNFIKKIDDCISHISLNPRAFPIINKELHIRKCVVSKNSSLFYKSSTDKIEIIRIYDTRQDPDKLNF